MSKLTKILLTIPSLIWLVYIITFWNNDLFIWVTNNIVSFEYQPLIVGILIYSVLIYLIYRIWSYKNIDKDHKWQWTFFLFIFNVITVPLYVWKKDDELIKKNKISSTPTNFQTQEISSEPYPKKQ
jgi:hypothetical protein